MDVRIVTYNTGLLRGGVPYAAERVDLVADAVANIDADVISLQELWSDADRATVLDSATGRFPHRAEVDPLPPLPGDWGLDGSTGLAVLSRWPIIRSAVIPLESSIVRRAILDVQIATPARAVRVLATHLTAFLRSVMHHNGEGGWAAEHLAQCELVADLIESSRGPIVLAGDLNCGPGRGGVPELPESYDVLRGAFEHSPYADDPLSGCTWCSENPLVYEEADTILDHIMVSGLRPTRPRRILTARVEIPIGAGIVEAQVADHYGVSLDLMT